MEETLKVTEAANGPTYDTLLGLHRIWNFVSPDRVEILSTGASLFIDPRTIRFIYDKNVSLNNRYAVDMSVLEGAKFFSFRLVYESEKMADTAILQLKDLLRNYDIYRGVQFPPEEPVSQPEEATVVEHPISFWGKLKYIFSQ